MDRARLRVELLEGELQRAGAALGGSLGVLPHLRRELEGLRGERRRLRRLLRRRLQELEETQQQIEVELERAATTQSDRVPQGSRGGSRGSRGAQDEAERERSRRRERQRRLRRFLGTKERARPPAARPQLKPRAPPETPEDPPEGMGEGLEPPREEEEEEEEEAWMDGEAQSFSQFLLLTEQHRELQELQQQVEQLRAAVAAAETPEEPGGPPGDPEIEIRELREQERRGREELEHLRAGLEELLAQLEEGQGDPDPPGDPPGDPRGDGDPLWEQLRRLEVGVTRLLLRGGAPPNPVLAGNEVIWSRPPPSTPPQPQGGPRGGGGRGGGGRETPEPRRAAGEGPARGAEPRGTPPHPPAEFGGSLSAPLPHTGRRGPPTQPCSCPPPTPLPWQPSKYLGRSRSRCPRQRPNFPKQRKTAQNEPGREGEVGGGAGAPPFVPRVTHPRAGVTRGCPSPPLGTPQGPPQSPPVRGDALTSLPGTP
ncbi:basic salivary proline-rich protein 2-like [Haemorhous mexicanus]|uniref:basic salivary proline-rich protein 2-like n=1 Tax=Haemorhous mexicanus TaxID=30427 RepID=UPI0028BF0F78|nr:basic salivary proline-rich protein 2-like [Haemorhous mexicanus]